MAITKIHAIQATVNKAVDYICNPAKTDESILISSFGCSPETAAFDFKFALSKTNQADPNKAFHLIQAFMPGEVSYKEAHQIGIELADKLLEGKYSYIVVQQACHPYRRSQQMDGILPAYRKRTVGCLPLRRHCHR